MILNFGVAYGTGVAAITAAGFFRLCFGRFGGRRISGLDGVVRFRRVGGFLGLGGILLGRLGFPYERICEIILIAVRAFGAGEQCMALGIISGRNYFLGIRVLQLGNIH